MRVVQALRWLRELLAKPDDRPHLIKQLQIILSGDGEGPAIATDLRQGLPTLPAWMQNLVRELLTEDSGRSGSKQQQDAGEEQQQRNAQRRSRPRADPREAAL